jgi:hypothetical protein
MILMAGTTASEFRLHELTQRFSHERQTRQQRRQHINPRRQRGKRRCHLAGAFLMLRILSYRPEGGSHKSAQGIALREYADRLLFNDPRQGSKRRRTEPAPTDYAGGSSVSRSEF